MQFGNWGMHFKVVFILVSYLFTSARYFCPLLSHLSVCTFSLYYHHHHHHYHYPSYHLYTGYLQLYVYTCNKPCFQGTQFCSCSVFTICATRNVISQVKYVLYLYVSTSRSMCAVPNMFFFCSYLISCFPGMLLRYCLSDFEKVPVAPVITSVTFVFTFHVS